MVNFSKIVAWLKPCKTRKRVPSFIDALHAHHVKELRVKLQSLEGLEKDSPVKRISLEEQPSKEVSEYLSSLFKTNPVLLAGWMAMEFAKDVHKGNVKEFVFEENCNVSDTQRVKVTLVGKIEEIN